MKLWHKITAVITGLMLMSGCLVAPTTESITSTRKIMPITYTLKGSVVDTASNLTLTVPNVSALEGERLVVVCLSNGYLDQGQEAPLRFNITWGSITGVGGSSGEWAANEVHTTPTTVTTISVDSPADPVPAGIHDLVVEWVDFFGPTPDKKMVLVFSLSGTPDWYFLNQPNTEGNDSSPLAPPVLMRRADSFIVAALGIVGPTTDTAGTWTGGFTGLARIGTNTGSDDRILDVGVIVNTVIGTYTAGKTGITARPWLIVPTIYDSPPAATPSGIGTTYSYGGFPGGGSPDVVAPKLTLEQEHAIWHGDRRHYPGAIPGGTPR